MQKMKSDYDNVGGLTILDAKNNEGIVKESITCYMCTLIIDRKTPIIIAFEMGDLAYVG